MSRLGIYADKIEAIREQKGLTPSGFRQDGSDSLSDQKRAMEADMYERADAHIAPFASALGAANAGDEDS